MSNFRPGHALTFDDVVLVPRHATVHPREVDISSRFTRSVPLNTPVVSAAMDTVTESEMAIAVARAGGIGVIHTNMPIDQHAAEIDRVKRSESGMILDPTSCGVVTMSAPRTCTVCTRESCASPVPGGRSTSK